MSKQLRIINIKDKTTKTLSDMYNLYEFESTYYSRSINTIGEEGLSSVTGNQFQPPRKSTFSISSSSKSKSSYFDPWSLLKCKKNKKKNQAPHITK
jgi:hypothetical protein